MEKATAAETAKTTARADYKLVEFPYFTDTMKDYTGTARPTFMTLAPNSITKIRVYIWIEGQDIDSLETDSEGAELYLDISFIKDTVGYDTFN